MWESATKLFLFRQYTKHIQFTRFCSVSSLAQLRSVSSDSELDESNLNNEHKDEIECNFSGSRTMEVVEKLYCLRKDPKTAVSFFDQLKRCGFSHNLWTYAAIVRVLCGCGWQKKLESLLLELVRKDTNADFQVTDLFEALCEEGPTLLSRVSDAMIKAYVSVGMFDKVIDVLFQTNRHGLVWSILSCNYFMNQLVECGKVDMALAVYELLKRLRLNLNEYTYVIVIKALSKKGSIQKAYEVFLEMDKAGVTPSEFAYSTCIEGICVNGKSDLGYELLLKWEEARVPLSSFAYTVVIRGLCDENKMKEAEGVWVHMEKQGVCPDVYAYSAMISGYCKYGNIDKALALLDEMQSKCIKLNCGLVSVILKAFCKKGMASEAIKLFLKFKEKPWVFLDKVCYDVIVDAFCKLGKVEEAMGLFNEMKDRRLTPDVVNYTTMICGYCHLGNLGAALDLFQEMKEMGHKPDIIAYNVLAGALARYESKQKALDLLNYMKTQGLEPDSVTHNMIIEGLCMGGKVEEAEAFLHGFEGKCLENYSAMVNGYCKADYIEEAFQLFMRLSKQKVLVRRSSCDKLLSNLLMLGNNNKAILLFKKMIKLNAEPSKRMYENLIYALCQAGDMDQAKLVFDDLVAKVMQSEEHRKELTVPYTMMIHGYCKKNCLREARDIFTDMKQKQVPLDAVTYTVLFDAHSKRNLEGPSLSDALQCKDDSADALDFLYEMEKNEIIPDVVCYTVLIARLCKTQNLEDAITVFNKIIDIGMEPDIVTYTALLCGYLSQGDLERANAHVDEMSMKGIQPDDYTMLVLERGIEKARNRH